MSTTNLDQLRQAADAVIPGTETALSGDHRDALVRPHTVFDIAATGGGAWLAQAFGVNFLLQASAADLRLAAWFNMIYLHDAPLNHPGWIIFTPQMICEDLQWSYYYMHHQLRRLKHINYLHQYGPRKMVYRVNPEYIWKGSLEAILKKDNPQKSFISPSDVARARYREGIRQALVGSVFGAYRATDQGDAVEATDAAEVDDTSEDVDADAPKAALG